MPMIKPSPTGACFFMNQKHTHEPFLKIEKILPILKYISIFGALNEKQLFAVFRLLEKTSYKEGEIIFREGEGPSYIYIIRSGQVKIVSNIDEDPFEIIVFKVGQCFGETSVIGIQPHAASALAMEDTELMILSQKALLELHQTDPELFGILILNIAREACRRLYKTDQILLHYAQSKKAS